MSPDFLRNAVVEPRATVLLAHGAMAPMDSAFLESFAALLVERGLEVVRFEFAYMAERRTGGKKRPPPRGELLRDEYKAAVCKLRSGGPVAEPLIIGGKSLGGRVASMVADDLHRAGRIAGLVCLGYPFHPPAKPGNLRTQHLASIDCPMLIAQGERDPFGTRAEVEGFELDARIRYHWVGDGDHDFGPRGKSGFTRRGNLEAAADALGKFAETLKRN